LQLQLLANFHFLLAAAFLKAANAFLAAVVFKLDVGVPLLKLANLAALLDQRLKALRPAQKHPAIGAGEDRH
jgi:hypothetical protein